MELTTAILRIFRDEGERKDRQKARLMWLVERYGEMTEVDGHAHCHPYPCTATCAGGHR